MSADNSATTVSSVDPRPYLPWCLGSFAASAVVIVLGNTNLRSGENGGTGPMIGSLVVCGVITAILYGLFGSGRRLGSGLAFGIVALVAMAVFWSGLPIVLGAAAVVLGSRARHSRNGRIAVWLGGVAVAVGFVLGVVAGLM